MRVLYFSTDYSPHDHRFLSALAGTQHEVCYVRLEGNQREADDRPVPSRIQQVHWAGGRGTFRWADVPRLTLDLKRVIRDIRPDLLHSGPVQTCAFLSVLSGFHPLLTMSWGFDLMEDAERNVWWRWVTRYTLSRSTFFVSDAEVTRQKAIGYGMKQDCTAVFPWGVDLKHFRPAGNQANPRSAVPTAKRPTGRDRRSPRAPVAPFVVFCNRSWESRYGVDVLAKAFVRVARERADVSLLLLGAGSMAQPIREILMGGNVMDRVQTPGRVAQENLPRWYQMADLYVSPSHVDGSSVSLMEALACGLPALVSDIPANKEWVTEGANGWLFPDGDANALADRILRIMDERGTLAGMGQAARKLAEKRADWSKNFAVLLKAYQQAAQARN